MTTVPDVPEKIGRSISTGSAAPAGTATWSAIAVMLSAGAPDVAVSTQKLR